MSGRFSERTLDEIRSRVDIVELIGARVTLKRSGSSHKGCCPFHQEKTPSFHVHPTKQFYHCFGCGESGDVFTFLMKQEGLSFNDAVRNLAQRVGVELEEERAERADGRTLLYKLHHELSGFYQRCLKQMASASEAREYLAERQIPAEIIERFKLGYAPHRPQNAILQWGAKHKYAAATLVSAGILLENTRGARGYYDRFKGRLIFPISDHRSRICGFSARVLKSSTHPAKYVNSPETEIFVKGHLLYGLDLAVRQIVKHPRREAIICEGQIDVIRCHACGFDTAVASQGTAFTKEQALLLKRYADSVVLAFDGDEAGRKAAIRTGAVLLEVQLPVRVARMPSGSDPDSVLTTQGAAVFRELLQEALSITAFQIETLLLNEERPESLDAVSRVSRSVLAMLAGCDSAVMRAHLLQEASELLKLSLTALELDLTRMIAEPRRYRDLVIREEEEQPAEVEAWEEAGEPASPGVGSGIRREAPPTRSEIALCEFMIEHESESEVIALIELHLPVILLRHSFTCAVVAALLEQQHSGTDQLVQLQESMAPEWQPLLQRLLINPQKMLSAREITSEQAAQDLVRRIWLERLKEVRGMLPAEGNQVDEEVRFTLTMVIKHFESDPWEALKHRMNPAYAAILAEEGDLKELLAQRG